MLLGNYVASAVVLLGLWFLLARPPGRAVGPRAHAADAALRPAHRAGRGLGLRCSTSSTASTSTAPARRPGAAGLYSLAVKLAAVVIIAVRAFQYAWPPLAYSVKDDHEASRLYATVATYYVLFTGLDRRRHDPARPLDPAPLRGARRSSAPTRPCPGSRSAGRSTACSSSSPSWPAGRRSRRATPRPRRSGWASTSSPWSCSSSRSASPAPASRCARLRRDGRGDVPVDARGCSRCRSSGAAWRTLVLVIAASPSPASSCCPPPAPAGSWGGLVALVAIPAVLAATGFLRAGETRRLRALVSRAGAARAA